MAKESKKTLTNTDAKETKKQVKDVEFFGYGDLFKLLSKASSKKEGWMKSTKAMEVSTGCIVQVTTQQDNNIAEALTFVHGVKIHEIFDADGICIGRTLVASDDELKLRGVRKLMTQLKDVNYSEKIPFITKVKTLITK